MQTFMNILLFQIEDNYERLSLKHGLIHITFVTLNLRISVENKKKTAKE